LRAGLIQSGVNTELITPSVSNFRIDKRTLKIDVDVKDSKLAQVLRRYHFWCQGKASCWMAAEPFKVYRIESKTT
jgi:hypothetical protein